MSDSQKTKAQRPQTEVWFFVGATFVLAGATAAASAGVRWAQYLGMAVGLVAIVCGFVVMARNRRR